MIYNNNSTASRQAQVSTPTGRRTETDAAAPSVCRDRLCPAHGMSVESLAEGIWEHQCDSSAFSAMAPGGFTIPEKTEYLRRCRTRLAGSFKRLRSWFIDCSYLTTPQFRNRHSKHGV